MISLPDFSRSYIWRKPSLAPLVYHEMFQTFFLRHDIFGNIIHKTDAHISVKDYPDYNDRWLLSIAVITN